jgi:hypothetical protein
MGILAQISGQGNPLSGLRPFRDSIETLPRFPPRLAHFIRTRTVKTFDCDIACNFGRKNCLSDDGL